MRTQARASAADQASAPPATADRAIPYHAAFVSAAWNPMKKFILIALLLLHGAAFAAERPRIGLVLSGGGARGVAHVGVLRVLEQLHVPIDVITGTSMGAIIGGLYASGMSPDAIEKALGGIDWTATLNDRPDRRSRPFRGKQKEADLLIPSFVGFSEGRAKLPVGLLDGQKAMLVLKKLTRPVAGIHDFDRLPIPFHAIATDIGNGEAVVLRRGDLALAMRASMSIPAVFSPVKWRGRLLVDGGVADNLPVAEARAMGADILIAVDISTPLEPRDHLDNVLTITNQLTSIMTRANTERSLRSLGPRDILILPELGDLTTTDFERGLEAVAPGTRAALAQRKRLERLAAVRLATRPHRRRSAVPAPIVDFIEFDNRSRLSDSAITARFHLRVGKRLDIAHLEHSIARLYGEDIFQRVDYDIVRRGGRTGLRIHVIEKSWGPDYLQPGLRLSGNLQGDTSFDLSLGYTLTNLDPRGGEFRGILRLGESPRLFAELYEPLDDAGERFINPQAEYLAYNVGDYVDGIERAEYRVHQFRLGLSGGRLFDNWGELRGGLDWRVGDRRLRTGDPSLPELNFVDTSLFLRFTSDTLDAFAFPAEGTASLLEWRAARHLLGGDDSYQQFRLEGALATHRGRNRLLLKARAGFTLDDDAPVQSLFRLGGFGRLSGFERDELAGQHFLHLFAGYYRRINDFQLLPVFAGATLEAGNTWQRRADIDGHLRLGGSLFLGIDTLAGPLYLGLGLAEGGRGNAFLYLGNPF